VVWDSNRVFKSELLGVFKTLKMENLAHIMLGQKEKFNGHNFKIMDTKDVCHI
jgi:hypothetical protein